MRSTVATPVQEVAFFHMTFLPQRHLSVPLSWPPTLLIVVDTEEEFDWDAPFDRASVQVRNIAEQPLAQAVLDAHGIAPTYVVDYPVAVSPDGIEILGGIAASGRCTIGAHLHPWVTPPHDGPIDAKHSFPGNLPPTLERAKLAALTEAIEAGFGVRPTIYKAGRYGVGPATATILDELGYRIDCSVVPFTSFSADKGPDFSAIADQPFMVTDRLIEVPLSVGFVGVLANQGRQLFPHLQTRLGQRLRLTGIAAQAGLLERLRLTPEGHSLQDLIRQTRAGIAAGKRLFMLTYHSSSLLPRGTPYVRSEADRRAFLGVLEGYCAYFMETLGGRPGTLVQTVMELTNGPSGRVAA
jgi:hypothetical protein